MISKKIKPAGDALGVFPSLLEELTTSRLAAKRAMQQTEDPTERSRLDAMQSSLKILINSFYGSLGYRKALFNDYAQADVVTKTGQQILRLMIAFIQEASGKVVEVDTDGIFFVPPATVQGEEQERAFVAALSQKLPEGITVSLDGRYRKMFSYKKKNYALLGYDDRIRIKGSSLISRSMEQFGRTYIHQAIDYLLNNDIEGLHALYTQLRQAILDHALDVKDFARVEAVKDPIAQYEEEVSAGRRNKSAAYEVARSSGRPVKPGDRIAYYITGNDPNPKSFENCKPAEEWDPHFPDENTPFYLRRLDEFSEKFAPLFQPRDHRALFSAEDLFPFNPAEITLLLTELGPGSRDSAEERAPQDFDIWLEE
jgi:DNA polymerase elongation subunit (family B)